MKSPVSPVSASMADDLEQLYDADWISCRPSDDGPHEDDEGNANWDQVSRSLLAMQAAVAAVDTLSGELEHASDLLLNMRREGVEHEAASGSGAFTNEAISACERAAAWSGAFGEWSAGVVPDTGSTLDLSSSVRCEGVEPKSSNTNAAMSACAKGVGPNKGYELDLLSRVRREGVEPKSSCTNAAMSAC